MLKKFVSFFIIISIALSISCVQAFAADTTGEDMYDKLVAITDLMKAYGLDVKKDADPIKDLLIKLFEEDPELFNEYADMMLKQIDKNSGYFPKEEYDTAYPTYTSYAGVGVTVDTARGDDGYYVITDISENSGASDAGIKPGDKIATVEGINVRYAPIADIIEILRGDEGTSVSIGVLRGNTIHTFKVERRQIGMPNISHTIIEDGIEYIALSRFFGGDTYGKFFQIYTNMPQNGTKALIIDLRGNPGGDVDMALNMLDIIIPDRGKNIVGVRSKTSGEAVMTYTSRGLGYRLNDIVILVDEHSASASEIFSGSLSDLGYATLVGNKTYGKGTGQFHIMFEDGSSAVLTTAEFLLPVRYSYNNVGLTPDVVVSNYTEPYKLPNMLSMPTYVKLLPGEKSDVVKALQQRLALLGYLDMDEQAFGTLDDATLSAVNVFRRMNKLPEEKFCSPETLRTVDAKITALSKTTVVVDAQLDKAIEIARKASEKPAQYTVAGKAS